MDIRHLSLEGAALIRPKRHGDARGWFSETWREDAFEAAGLPTRFVQDNHAFSDKAFTLRGLHFQAPPHGQGKLIRCSRGAIFDVIVDLRPSSPSFGSWLGETLDADGGAQLFVPVGFAHGYLTLTSETEVQYKTTSAYAPDAEFGLAWDDPEIAIEWPLDGRHPTLSAKDAKLPGLAAYSRTFAELA